MVMITVNYITGDIRDTKGANKAMGIKGTPDGYMWHHVEHTKILIAIPRDLHDAIKHTGGRATNKVGVKK